MAKKKRSITRMILLPVLLLTVAATATYYITGYLSRPRFVRYEAFGIEIPANYPIHGIDVSRYQDNIDWTAVKQMQDKKVRIGFAFIKATEGLDMVDEKFRQNWFRAKQSSLPRGAYHFFNSGKSGRAQAGKFMETVTLKKGDLPPVLDIESANGASVMDIQQRAMDWLQMIEQHYKIRPVIYTNIDFYKNFLQDKFDDYPLWVAHYYAKDKPAINRKWSFWQHNEKGRVNGVDAYVDFNVFNGDSTAFQKMLMK